MDCHMLELRHGWNRFKMQVQDRRSLKYWYLEQLPHHPEYNLTSRGKTPGNKRKTPKVTQTRPSRPTCTHTLTSLPLWRLETDWTAMTSFFSPARAQPQSQPQYVWAQPQFIRLVNVKLSCQPTAQHPKEWKMSYSTGKHSPSQRLMRKPNATFHLVSPCLVLTISHSHQSHLESLGFSRLSPTARLALWTSWGAWISAEECGFKWSERESGLNLWQKGTF